MDAPIEVTNDDALDRVSDTTSMCCSRCGREGIYTHVEHLCLACFVQNWEPKAVSSATNVRFEYQPEVCPIIDIVRLIHEGCVWDR